MAVKKKILVAAAALALISALLLLYGAMISPEGTNAVQGSVAEIYFRSKLVRRIALKTAPEGDFSLPELPEVVFHVYGDGTIAFVHSDCPDQICVRTGKISRQGQFAACLPNEVCVKIVSGHQNSENEDIVLG